MWLKTGFKVNIWTWEHHSLGWGGKGWKAQLWWLRKNNFVFFEKMNRRKYAFISLQSLIFLSYRCPSFKILCFAWKEPIVYQILVSGKEEVNTTMAVQSCIQGRWVNVALSVRVSKCDTNKKNSWAELKIITH